MPKKSKSTSYAFGASNEPGTCLWCGSRLERERYQDDPTRLGNNGEGFFCRSRCAYLFACAAVRSAFRIEPVQKTEAEG